MIYEFNSVSGGKKISYVFQAISGRKLSNAYHSHDFYEWLVVLNGRCRHRVNEQNIEFVKNECVLLCPGDGHCFLTQSEDISLLCLSVKECEERDFERLFGLERTECTHMMLTQRQSKALADLYFAANEYEYKLMLANFMKIYIENSHGKDNVPATVSFAMAEMSEKENLKGGAERFCELSGYSRSHMNRLMRSCFGMTIHEYILNMRLECAYNMLIISDVGAERIAEEVGYESFAHFCKIFKKKYGITPAELRRKNKIITI